ncbi:MAG TPA: NDP-sugar synthase [Planktothrix sp.]|jgi:NDP-sugar pyrophosphorylase family protein
MQGRNEMKAMILAAGVGSRLDPLTSQVPKPLVPVVNTPVMEHIINLLRSHGFTEICANLHYLPEKIVEYFGDGSRFGVKLTLRHEQKLSGDAGGVRSCRDFLSSGTFLVTMGDLLTDADLSAIVAKHKEKKALASIAVKQVPLSEVHRFGVVVTNGDGFITGFQEKPSAEEALSTMISTGIYVLEPEVFDHMPAAGDFGFGRQLFPQLVAKGLPVLGVEIENYWSDVGTIQQYRESNFDALAGHVALEMKGTRQMMGAGEVWLGEGATIGSGIKVTGQALVGKNSRIGKNCVFDGNVVIGEDCVIQDGVQLKDTVIWSGATVEADAHLEHSVIGYGCVVSNASKHFEVAAVAPVSPLNACAV